MTTENRPVPTTMTPESMPREPRPEDDPLIAKLDAFVARTSLGRNFPDSTPVIRALRDGMLDD